MWLIPARAGRTTTTPTRRFRPRAHPRSRGADTQAAVDLSAAGGSSPLARGGLPACGHGDRDRGLIPARAGRTPHAQSNTPTTRAHPRSRGADSKATAESSAVAGSSPLARGGRIGPSVVPVAGGLIPARAGRTWIAFPPDAGVGAHPRSRGADIRRLPFALGKKGSSPLARGGLACRTGVEGSAGLIPARAGRTEGGAVHPRVVRAHPRSRGADGTRRIARHM